MKKEYKHYLVLTLYVLLVFFIVTRFNNVFGSDTDWINQHTIFPDYFSQMFYKTGKLIPNLAINYGAGQNFFNLSYYGLLSPVFILSYLLPFIDMTTYVIISNLLFSCLVKVNIIESIPSFLSQSQLTAPVFTYILFIKQLFEYYFLYMV